MLLIGINGQTRSGKDTVANRLCDEHSFVRVALADPMKRFGMQVFDFSQEQMFGPQETRNAHDKRYNLFSKFEMDNAWAEAYNSLCEYGFTLLQDIMGIPDVDNPVLKRAFRDLLDWFEWLGTNHAELTPRIMLQTLGTEWGRSVDEDLWVKYLLRVKGKLADGYHDYSMDRGVFRAVSHYKGVVVPDIRFFNEFNHLKQRNGFLIRIRRPETDDEAAFIGVAGHSSEKEQKGISDDQFNMIILNDGTLDELYNTVDVIPTILRSKDV